MALPNATWDGSKIVTVVSRFTGLAGDTQSRAAVLDYVNLALWEISLQTNWKWNFLTATDMTVTAGVSTYPLPTASGSIFDEVYDVRLVGDSERTLFPTDLRSYDRYAQGNQDGASVPTWYYLDGSYQSGNITLVPPPAASDTLRIRYYARQATISDATSSSMSMPDKYVPLVIFKAAENVAAWKTPDRVGYWNGKYNAALARAVETDRVSPDETPAFVPQAEHGRPRLIDGLNITDLDVYPRG